MALPAEPTLGELAARLATRMGGGGQGAGTNRPLLRELLISAHAEVYRRLRHTLERAIFPVTIGTEQRWLDFPDNCDPDRIREIRVDVTGDGDWATLHEGIEADHDSVRTHRTWPRRYDRIRKDSSTRPQIELWPLADTTYLMEIEARLLVSSFAVDSDTTTMPGEIVLDLATADGLADRNRRVWGRYAARAQRAIKDLRAQAHGNRRYVPGQQGQRETWVRPRLETT